MGMAVLRRLGSKNGVQELWRLGRNADTALDTPCPVCSRAMAEVPLPARKPEDKSGEKEASPGPRAAESEPHNSEHVLPSPPGLRLDVCIGCQSVWFDPREFGQFPSPQTAKSKPLSGKARELIAVQQIQQVAKDAESASYGAPGPDELWQMIPALLGMPVEEAAPAVRCWPWLTYGLGAALVLAYALTAGNLQAIVEECGMVPAQWGRYHGATLLTSFFLHAGLLHLIGNVYFLLIFGDNVEDDLGRWRCVVVIATAALFGDLLHILNDPGSTIPCIGASGGISGILTYYALRFPRARLGYLFCFWPFYFRWIHMPAFVALFFWFLLQFVLVLKQRLGVGDVAAMAHLGGAGVGVVAWCLWRAGSLRGA